MATLAEIYVAAALRVKTSFPRALHFLTVSRLRGQGWGLVFTSHLPLPGQGTDPNVSVVSRWAAGPAGVSSSGLGLNLEPLSQSCSSPHSVSS